MRRKRERGDERGRERGGQKWVVCDDEYIGVQSCTDTSVHACPHTFPDTCDNLVKKIYVQIYAIKNATD